MDNSPDRPDAQLPAWPAAPMPGALPQKAWDEQFDGAPGARMITPRVIWRAFCRHWWQVLLLWAVGSAALVALAYTKIKPTYQSTAWLKVEQPQTILGGQPTNPTDMSSSLETQVALITSPDVLSAAVLEPKVAALSRIRTSLDPEADLRKELKVSIVGRTSLILVEMATESPVEAATIVEAVVNSFLKSSSTWTDHETRVQLSRLKELQKRFQVELSQQRDALRKLYNNSVSAHTGDKDRNLVTVDQYRSFKKELGDVEIERIEAESQLRFLQDVHQRTQRLRGRGGSLNDKDLAAAVEAAFLAEPTAASLQAQIKQAEGRVQDLKRTVRKMSDPSITKAVEYHEKLRRDWEDLWDTREPVIRHQLTSQTGDELDRSGEMGQVQMAQLVVQRYLTREEELKKRLKTLEVQAREDEGGALDIQFAKADEAHTLSNLEQVSKQLERLEYDGRNGPKISLAAPAKITFKPQTNRRMAIMAAAPIGMMIAVMGLFVLIEAKAGRVVDPEDLPSRVRIGVIGVVPPLPTLEPPRGARGVRDEKRRVEEFVQSLDQLRVTLCAGRTGQAGRRCILITSACGGEGKTTLAAQLAGRCANAGLSTLLVDADLRRPSLGELLEVPEGPGLADILAGDTEPEQAMVVIGNAGGFHLLPAGTLGMDPSRLLQGERLGTLIAQLRATFDVVIVDAPPVLAVPDALLLGRWTDGAVLAVRHETSRFPLVERANRRLAAIGIPVFGAVVNGVRAMGSYYGAYHYYSAYHYASTGPAVEPGPRPS